MFRRWTWRRTQSAIVVTAVWGPLACGSDPAEGPQSDDTGGSGSTGEEGPEGSSGEGGGSTTDGVDQTGSDTADETADDTSGTGAMPFADVYELPVTYPEGGAFDPVDEVFYVGTLEGGSVFAVDPYSGEGQPLVRAAKAGTWMTLGMAVDASSHRLWVCAADRDTDPFTGELWVFDLASGERTHQVPLMFEGAPGWCEDVAIASDGTAYATDRDNPAIYGVDDSYVAEVVASDPALASEMIGQNGIVVLPGDETLIAAIHAPPQLNRVSVSDGSVTPIAIDGDFSDVGFGVGADGMVYEDGLLFVVFDGKLAQVTPVQDDWSEAQSTTVEWPRGLTDVLATPAGLYLLNGQAIRFALGQEPKGPFELVRFTGEF